MDYRCASAKTCWRSVGLTSATRRSAVGCGNSERALPQRSVVAGSRGFGSTWRWHIDEVFVKINGQLFYMWRVIDHEGEVLEVFVSKRRDKAAAMKVLKKAMRRHGKPDEIVTDKCPSYGAALRDLNAGLQHITDQYANNLSEVSHQPFRRRERSQQRFRSHGSLQVFASTHGCLYNHFNTERHKISRARMKQFRSAANAEWSELLAA